VPSSEERTFHRTSVHRESSAPWFDQKFSFEVLPADIDKRVFVSAWHRDKEKRQVHLITRINIALTITVAHFQQVFIKLPDSERRVLQARYGRRLSRSCKLLLAFASRFVFGLGPRWTPWAIYFTVPGPARSSSQLENGLAP
jgi:hypothetical protein